jgi:hypothetical protein
MAFGKEDDG